MAGPRRRAIWLGGLAALVATLLALGHWGPDAGLRWALNRALHQLGWTQVAIAHADLSLFNGAIVIKSMEAGPGLGRALGIDGIDLRFRWKPLLSKRVAVDSLGLSGVVVEARRSGDRVEINGLPVAVGGSDAAGAWTFDITSLVLTDSRLELTDGALRISVRIDRLELAGLRSWQPDAAATFRLTGAVNGAPIVLSGSATPFAAAPGAQVSLELSRLDLAGLADLARRAGMAPPAGKLDARLELDIQGRHVAADGRLGVKGGALAWDGGRLHAETLDWSGKAAWGAEQRLSGTLGAQGLALDLGSERLTVERAGWSGEAALDTLSFAGKGTVDHLRFVSGDVHLGNRRLAFDGTLSPATAAGLLPPLAGQADLVVDGFSLGQGGREWLAAERIDARGARLSPGQPAAVTRIDLRTLGGLALKGDGGYSRRVEARQASLEEVHVDPDGRASMGALNVGGAVIRAVRTPKGWVGLESAEGQEGASAMPSFAIGRFRLDGRSRLEFEDRTLQEPVRLAFDGVDVSARALDSARPNQDSPFTVKARLGEGRIAASGDIRPFAPVFAGRLSATAAAIELPALSPYAAAALGVHLHTGQLDAEAKAATDDGRLTGQMELTLAQLYVAQPDPNAKLAKQADMPIETVLDLLRDSEGRIRLSIPVRGELTNPDFDVSDAVGQAVAGALKSTVLTTLKVAFPVAALIGLVIDEAEKPHLGLEPLKFEPGSSRLESAASEQLSTIGGLLRQRPGLKLTLCGTADSHADWPALLRQSSLLARLQTLVGKEVSAPPDRDRLLALADERARTVKSHLVERAGIDPGRLFTCRPQVDEDGKFPPGVRLML